MKEKLNTVSWCTNPELGELGSIGKEDWSSWQEDGPGCGTSFFLKKASRVDW
jgi:hypothetical protein